MDDPGEVFKKIILFPLLECEAQHKVVILLVDGLDLVINNNPGAAATGKIRFKAYIYKNSKFDNIQTLYDHCRRAKQEYPRAVVSPRPPLPPLPVFTSR